MFNEGFSIRVMMVTALNEMGIELLLVKKQSNFYINPFFFYLIMNKYTPNNTFINHRHASTLNPIVSLFGSPRMKKYPSLVIP